MKKKLLFSTLSFIGLGLISLIIGISIFGNHVFSNTGIVST